MHLYRSWTPEDVLQACCGTVCVLCMRLHRTGLKQSCVWERTGLNSLDVWLHCRGAMQCVSLPLLLR